MGVLLETGFTPTHDDQARVLVQANGDDVWIYSAHDIVAVAAFVCAHEIRSHLENGTQAATTLIKTTTTVASTAVLLTHSWVTTKFLLAIA